MMMKRIATLSFVWLCLLCLMPSARAQHFGGVDSLVKRRVPWLSGHVRFDTLASEGQARFRLHTTDGRLLIKATDANTAAVGLNWYLKYYCRRSMSHMADFLSTPDTLPVVPRPVTIETASTYRCALNYCTYNYSFSFYTWDDWQWELDWMALNGVNLMLVANGAEAVWQNVLRRMNYSEEEIARFITGPAYNAWWLMGNVQGWGGQMPASQIDSRRQLVQQMLHRMKELGIEPLMPGFYGMVPSDLKTKSEAHIITQGKWITFTRPDILDPLDPEFDRVADLFYQETRRLYGSDIRFFSGDPFHEGGSSEGVSLGRAGRTIQQAMQRHYPGSIWVLQGWQDNPKSTLLEQLDKRYVLVQELFGENTNNWEQRCGYEGTPFLWCTVTNFGERPGINGKLQRLADEVYRASHSEYRSLMQGVGILPEGIFNNPVAYQLVLELPWHSAHVDVSQWISHFLQARYGKVTPEVNAAWQLMLRSIHSSEVGRQEGPPENVLCARPSLHARSVSSWGSIDKKYDFGLFNLAVSLLARAQSDYADVRTYKIDLIHCVRQLIANRADSVHTALAEAYSRNDLLAFDRYAHQFLSLIDAEDELLSHDPFFKLSYWQQQALQSGNNPAEKANNLRNLMMLITYWGGTDRADDSLHDYAYKEWAGMMSAYYKPRWELYFTYLRGRLKGETPAPVDFFEWERQWVERNLKVSNDSPARPFGEVVESLLTFM